MIPSGLLFIPADLPQTIDKNEVLNNFKPKTDWGPWSFQKLTDKNDGKYGRNPLTDTARELFPTLCNFIDNLPFTDLSNAKINIQNKKTTLHIDFVSPEDGKELSENVTQNEPSGYRIIIRGDRHALKAHDGKELITAYVPPQTDCYILDQSGCSHLVEEDEQRVSVYVTGFIDKKKHEELLLRSLEKYSDYAIWRNE